MKRWIPSFSVHRPVTVITLFAVVFVVGLIAWFRVPVQMMPSGWVTPRMWVWVDYEDSTPLETEARLVRPLEEQIATVAGIKHIGANADSGGASLSLEFHGGMDMDEAYNAVGDRVELFGANRMLDDAATAAGTIAYELLTSVTARVPRVYVG